MLRRTKKIAFYFADQSTIATQELKSDDLKNIEGFIFIAPIAVTSGFNGTTFGTADYGKFALSAAVTPENGSESIYIDAVPLSFFADTTATGFPQNTLIPFDFGARTKFTLQYLDTANLLPKHSIAMYLIYKKSC